MTLKSFRIAAIAFVAGLLAAGPAAAEEPDAASEPLPIAVVNQEQLFSVTLEGRAIRADMDRRAAELASANRQLEQELEAEERQLTELRKTLDPERFRELAAEFDARVSGIRTEQQRKLDNLGAIFENARAGYFSRAVPVLLAIMEERGIKVILDGNSVLLATGLADITGEAIERMNAEYLSGRETGEVGEQDVLP